jgi:hypothetical protein
MATVQVFEPGMCCGTGICGVDVDQRLVDFSADLDYVRRQGAAVDRFNLAQEPLAFAESDTARAFLHTVGSEGLPLTVVDGSTVLTGRYPSRPELEKWSGLGEKTAAPTLVAAGVQPAATSQLFPLSPAGSVAVGAAESSCCGGTTGGCC